MSMSLSFLYKSISGLLGLYSTLIIIRVLLSWILMGRSVYDNKITAFIAKLTDPYMNIFRSVKALKTNRIDFSPILALIPLNVLQSVFTILASYGIITIPVVAALIIQSLWNYLFKFIFKFWLILMGVRIAVNLFNSPTASNVFNFIDPMINTPVCWVWNIFYKNKQPDDKKLVITAFIFYLILYFIMNRGLGFLITYLCSL